MGSSYSLAILNDTYFFAKRDVRNGRRVACQNLTVITIMVSFPSSVIAWKAPENNFRCTVNDNLLNICAFFINIILSLMTCILYIVLYVIYIYIYLFIYIVAIHIFFSPLSTARVSKYATNGLVTILLQNVSTINYYHYHYHVS